MLLYVYDYEKYERENGVNINLFEELPNCVSKDIRELITVIDEDRYNDIAYQKFREKYISNLNGDSTNKIIELIKESL